MKYRQRHLGRELALQWLFEIEVGHQAPEQVTANVPQDIEELETLDEEGVGFAQQLVRGVRAHQQEIDRVISKFTKGWPLDRIAAIERNVLRLALYEIMYMPDVPSSVSANEAVEIAKHYASDESGKFVNGILGAYLRSDEGKKIEKEEHRHK